MLFTECHWYSGFARNAGAYRIATELRSNGFSVQVVDFFGFMTKDDVSKILQKYVGVNTLALCFSSTFFNRSLDSAYENNEQDPLKFLLDRNNSFSGLGDDKKMDQDFPFSDEIMSQIIDDAKEINSKLKVVYGGAKAQHQKAPFVDCFIVDFGEKAIVQYLQQLRLDRMFGTALADSQTLLAFDKETDDFNFAESRILWDENDFIFPGEVVPIEVSRGCVFSCKFCSYLLTGKKNLDHLKKIDVLYGELMDNYESKGITKYIFCDDTFNDSTEKLKRIAEVKDKLPFELSIAGYVRPELTMVFPEQLELLKHIGLRFAKMGIESLNTDTRKAIGKGLSFDKILRCLSDMRDCWGDQVITSGSFVFGLPYETRESLQIQEEWLLKEALDVLHCVSILPLFINFGGVETTKKSEIAINYKDYGYTHLGGRNWTNPSFDFTFEELKQRVSKIYKAVQQDKRYKHGGFSAIMIQNSGIEFNDIATKPFADLNYYGAQQEYARKISIYKQKLLK